MTSRPTDPSCARSLPSCHESKGDTTPFDDAEPLATGGRLDSPEIIQLVGFMEESFGVDFANVEFNRAHFDSIVSMSEFLSWCRKR